MESLKYKKTYAVLGIIFGFGGLALFIGSFIAVTILGGMSVNTFGVLITISSTFLLIGGIFAFKRSQYDN